jgi:hypothetical protein
MMRSWLVITALVACGDNFADPAEPRSGSRLKLHYFQYEDGTLELARDHGFFDVEREERCWPVQFSDGFTYCAPIDVRGAVARTIFTSSDCTAQLGELSRDAPELDHVVHEFWVGDEFLPSSLFRIGSIVGQPARRYELRDGACHGPLPVKADRLYVELREQVQRSQLVQLERTAVSGSARIAFTVDTSQDGLQVPAITIDRDLGVECALRPSPGDDTVLECHPRGASEALYFHDTACTERMVLAPVTKPMPAVAVTREGACPTYRHVRLQTGGPLYLQTEAGCSRWADGTSAEYQYLVAEPVELGTVSVRHEISDRRLHRVVAGNRDIAVGLLDTMHGHRCRATSLATFGLDIVRCMPEATTWVQVFDDPECNTPRVIAEVRVQGCDPRPYFAQGRGLDSRFAVYPIGEELDTFVDAVYTIDRQSGICVRYDPFNTTLHAVGDEIPIDAFPAPALLREQ